MSTDELRATAERLREQATRAGVALCSATDRVAAWRLRTESAMLRAQARELIELADFRDDTDAITVGLGEQAMTREVGSPDPCRHGATYSSDCPECQRLRREARDLDESGMTDPASPDYDPDVAEQDARDGDARDLSFGQPLGELIDAIAAMIGEGWTGRPWTEVRNTPNGTIARRIARRLTDAGRPVDRVRMDSKISQAATMRDQLAHRLGVPGGRSQSWHNMLGMVSDQRDGLLRESFERRT